MWHEEYIDCLDYIDKYWEKIIFRPSKMLLKHKLRNLTLFSSPLSSIQKLQVKNTNVTPHFVNIPFHYFVPNDNKFKYLFYWDSYFMFRGIMGTKREWIMREMINNFTYLFNTYKIIPNFNTAASMNRSQPPFFSSMIFDTYFTPLNPTNPHHLEGLLAKQYELKNKHWLKQAMDVAFKEYELVWIDKEGMYNHRAEGYSLSRYGDRDIGYSQSSELESGWDMTSRYFNRCDQFLPVDLNSYLYKYELDLLKINSMFPDEKGKQFWLRKAEVRKGEMNKYMWDEKQGFFYDYGYTNKLISNFLSLAGFSPMWAGIATHEQAKRMVEKLPKFETPYGLTITAKESLAEPIDLSRISERYHPAIEQIVKPKQWDYPSIWSPLEYQTVIGLLKYGFIEEARRIMVNSVKTHARLFRAYDTFFEKLDGSTGGPTKSFHYANQKGFGWTNAVFYRYIQILTSLDMGESIYVEPKPETPPYELAILH